jgi:hypothetical protein
MGAPYITPDQGMQENLLAGLTARDKIYFELETPMTPEAFFSLLNGCFQLLVTTQADRVTPPPVLTRFCVPIPLALSQRWNDSEPTLRS